MLSPRNGAKSNSLSQSRKPSHDVVAKKLYTNAGDLHLYPYITGEEGEGLSPHQQISKRILAKVFILLWMDLSIPLWEVIFSFVAIAMLQEGRKRNNWVGNGELPCSIHHISKSTVSNQSWNDQAGNGYTSLPGKLPIVFFSLNPLLTNEVFVTSHLVFSSK